MEMELLLMKLSQIPLEYLVKVGKGMVKRQKETQYQEVGTKAHAGPVWTS